MLIGYARVSTHYQNLDLQQDALKKAGCEKIFVDEVSGAGAARPGLQQAMDQLREGDVLVVWRLDRLGRSLRNLLELVAQLEGLRYYRPEASCLRVKITELLHYGPDTGLLPTPYCSPTSYCHAIDSWVS